MCYDEVKGALTTLPTISPPKWDKEFFVNPSARDISVGAFLMQKNEEIGYMKPIHFASKVMTSNEKTYTPSKQVICALMLATNWFFSYLLPKIFTIIFIEDTFPYAL